MNQQQLIKAICRSLPTELGKAVENVDPEKVKKVIEEGIKELKSHFSSLPTFPDARNYIISRLQVDPSTLNIDVETQEDIYNLLKLYIRKNSLWNDK